MSLAVCQSICISAITNAYVHSLVTHNSTHKQSIVFAIVPLLPETWRTAQPHTSMPDTPA